MKQSNCAVNTELFKAIGISLLYNITYTRVIKCRLPIPAFNGHYCTRHPYLAQEYQFPHQARFSGWVWFSQSLREPTPLKHSE